MFCPSCGTPTGRVSSTARQVVTLPPAPGAAPLPRLDLGSSVPPNPARRSGKGWRTLALGSAALTVVSAICLVVLLGGDDQAAPPLVTVAAPSLAASEPTDVDLGEADIDTAQVHEVSLRSGERGTVFVTAEEEFAPRLVVLEPGGSPIGADPIALGERGAALTFTASERGDYEVTVSAFEPGQGGYTVEFVPDVRFVSPGSIRVGGCVDRREGERWETVNGFILVACSQTHDGQVFAQIEGFDGNARDAHDACDEARSAQIPVAGYIDWQAYWGDGLTCVLRSRNASGIQGTLVRA